MNKFFKLFFVIGILIFALTESVYAQCLIISNTQTNVSCFGGNDGTITLNITPGTIPNAQPPFNVQLYYNSGGLTLLSSITNTSLTSITFAAGNGTLNQPGADSFGIPANGSGEDYQIFVQSQGGTIICRNKVLLGIVITEPLQLISSVSSVSPACTAGTGAISLNVSGGTSPYTFNWTGPTAIANTVQNPTGLNGGSYNVTVVDAKNCSVTISNIAVALSTTANAGADQSVCTNVATLNGSPPGPGEKGLWTLVSGSGTITSPTLFNTTITGLGFGNNVFNWFVNDIGNVCVGTNDAVTITREIPATANAGSDQTICNGSVYSLAGSSIGGSATTGAWSITSQPVGGDGVLSSTLPTATPSAVTFSATVVGAYTLTLSTDDPVGPCPIVTDQVIITVVTITASNAGPGQTICSTGSATLAANTPTVGTGAWTVTSGPDLSPSQFSSTGSPTATFTPGGGAGSYVLTWTITNAPCAPSASNVTISVDAPPTSSNAGPDQTLCNVTTATLSGNTPVIGTGSWSVVSGTATITTPSSPSSGLTGLVPGTTATLRWTIANGACPASTDDVDIVVSLPPTPSNAGVNQAICSTGSATLAANTATVGTGAWTVTSGPDLSPSQFSSTSNPTAAFTPAGGAGSYVLTWTITNAPCTPSTSNVTITVDDPPTPSNAGPDQTLCNVTIATLSGNTPVIGTGSWSVVSGTATITTPSSPVSGLTGLVPGATATLRWTITNGACPVSTDDVDIVVSLPPTASNAGINQTICSTASATLAANTPSVGTGAWTVTSGPDLSPTQFSSTGNPAATFTPAGGTGSYVLTWTITNSPCTPSTSNVTITVDPPPTSSNAGPDQTLCNVTTASLSGNAPVIGNGSWSVVSGTATITAPSSPSSGLTGLVPGTTATLRWTITNSACPASTDDVDIVVSLPSTISNAGPGQTICSTGSATLAANTPTAGTGVWTINSGPNLSATQFSSTSNPTATFTPAGGAGTYILTWTITNAPCASSASNVTINVNTPPAVSAPSSSLCVGANMALSPTTGGTWLSSDATIATVTNAGVVTGVSAGSVTFTYTNTVTNCSNTTSLITINALPTVNAPSSSLCLGSTMTLSPTTGGTWVSSNSAVATVTNGGLVTGVTTGTASFTFTETSTGCSRATNAVAVVSAASITVPTSAVTRCQAGGLVNLTTLVSATPSGGTFVFSGTGVTGNNFDPTSLNGNVNITVDYSTGSCTAPQANFNINVIPGGTVTTPSSTIGICGGSGTVNLATLVSATPTGGTFTFTGPGVTGSTFDPTSLSGIQTINVNYNSPGCNGTGTIVFNVSTSPTLTITNPNICQNAAPISLTSLVPASPSGGNFVFTGTGVTGTNFSPASLTGVVPVNVNYSVAGCSAAATGTINITILPTTNATCGGTGTGLCGTVLITPKPSPATCTLSNGKIVFSIKPFVPAVNPNGVKISITGISTTNQTIARTNFNDSTFLNLPIGTYDYVIEYGDVSCTKTGKVTIDQSGTVGTPSASNIVGPACAGSSTGSLKLDVAGETGNVLQWSLDGINFTNFTAGSVISGIPAGNAPSFQRVISVRRNTSDPCFAAVTITMQDPSPITATVTSSNATCANNDGFITVSGVTGGVGPYTYQLDGNPVTLATGNRINNLAGGNYIVSVVDAQSCKRDFPVTVVFPGFVVTTTPVVTQPDCAGQGVNGTIGFSILSSGTFTVGYTTHPINQPTVFVDYGTPNILLQGLATGDYYIWIKPNTAACATKLAKQTVTGSFTQVSLDAPVVSCVNGAPEIRISNIKAAAGPFTIQVTKKGQTVPDRSIALSTIPAGALYIIRGVELPSTKGDYTINIIQTQASCTISSSTYEITYNGVLAVQVANLKFSYPDLPTGGFDLVDFVGGTQPYAVTIRFDSAANPQVIPTDFTPRTEEVTELNNALQYVKSYKALHAGRYHLTVTEKDGCALEFDVRVPLDFVFDPNTIPNVFTPNGDGANDTFFIRNIPPGTQVNISSRWGAEVYSSKDYQNDWTGSNYPDGVYFYRINAAGNTFTGWVEIIRGK